MLDSDPARHKQQAFMAKQRLLAHIHAPEADPRRGRPDASTFVGSPFEQEEARPAKTMELADRTPSPPRSSILAALDAVDPEHRAKKRRKLLESSNWMGLHQDQEACLPPPKRFEPTPVYSQDARLSSLPSSPPPPLSSSVDEGPELFPISNFAWPTAHSHDADNLHPEPVERPTSEAASDIVSWTQDQASQPQNIDASGSARKTGLTFFADADEVPFDGVLPTSDTVEYTWPTSSPRRSPPRRAQDLPQHMDTSTDVAETVRPTFAQLSQNRTATPSDQSLARSASSPFVALADSGQLDEEHTVLPENNDVDEALSDSLSWLDEADFETPDSPAKPHPSSSRLSPPASPARRGPLISIAAGESLTVTFDDDLDW